MSAGRLLTARLTPRPSQVYVWLKYFGYDDAAARTLDAVLGFMRSLPNWAWHGGSRSMGDLGNNGKWFINKGVERGLMHYRAGLNMIPLLEAFRADPTDHLLLEIAMGALAGARMCPPLSPTVSRTTSLAVSQLNSLEDDAGVGMASLRANVQHRRERSHVHDVPFIPLRQRVRSTQRRLRAGVLRPQRGGGRVLRAASAVR